MLLPSVLPFRQLLTQSGDFRRAELYPLQSFGATTGLAVFCTPPRQAAVQFARARNITGYLFPIGIGCLSTLRANVVTLGLGSVRDFRQEQLAAADLPQSRLPAQAQMAYAVHQSTHVTGLFGYRLSLLKRFGSHGDGFSFTENAGMKRDIVLASRAGAPVARRPSVVGTARIYMKAFRELEGIRLARLSAIDAIGWCHLEQALPIGGPAARWATEWGRGAW